mgnify:CR=1
MKEYKRPTKPLKCRLGFHNYVICFQVVIPDSRRQNNINYDSIFTRSIICPDCNKKVEINKKQ